MKIINGYSYREHDVVFFLFWKVFPVLVISRIKFTFLLLWKSEKKILSIPYVRYCQFKESYFSDVMGLILWNHPFLLLLTFCPSKITYFRGKLISLFFHIKIEDQIRLFLSGCTMTSKSLNVKTNFRLQQCIYMVYGNWKYPLHFPQS